MTCIQHFSIFLREGEKMFLTNDTYLYQKSYRQLAEFVRKRKALMLIPYMTLLCEPVHLI